MAGTVKVGCKLPNGIIIFLGDTEVTLKGTNASQVIGGHGITENVDEDFFNAWLAANAEFPPVKNGYIFAHKRIDSLTAEATEKTATVSGFEPLNPDAMGKGLESLVTE